MDDEYLEMIKHKLSKIKLINSINEKLKESGYEGELVNIVQPEKKLKTRMYKCVFKKRDGNICDKSSLRKLCGVHMKTKLGKQLYGSKNVSLEFQD